MLYGILTLLHHSQTSGLTRTLTWASSIFLSVFTGCLFFCILLSMPFYLHFQLFCFFLFVGPFSMRIPCCILNSCYLKKPFGCRGITKYTTFVQRGCMMCRYLRGRFDFHLCLPLIIFLRYILMCSLDQISLLALVVTRVSMISEFSVH